MGADVRRMLPIVAAAAVLAAGGAAFLAVRTPSPEQVAARLLHARYVNDAAAVYELASAEDRRWRTLEQHVAGHPQFPAEFQELIGELGEFIEIGGVESDLQDAGGTVTVHGTVPNANHPEVRDLLYGEGAAAASPLDERRDELRRRGRAAALPVIEFSQAVELVREGEHWKAFLDWAVGFTIRFRAEVREQLPLEFKRATGEHHPQAGRDRLGDVPRAQCFRRHRQGQGGPPVRSTGGVSAHRAGCSVSASSRTPMRRGRNANCRWLCASAGTYLRNWARSPCCTSTTRWTNSATAGPPRRAMGSGGSFA